MAQADRPSADRLMLDGDALARFMQATFGDAIEGNFGEIETIVPGFLRVRHDPSHHVLRLGKTLTGPTLMALVDVAAFALAAAHVGEEDMVLTNALTIHFLRAARPEPLFIEATLLRLGRRLATVETKIRPEGSDDWIAQATVSFAMP